MVLHVPEPEFPIHKLVPLVVTLWRACIIVDREVTRPDPLVLVREPRIHKLVWFAVLEAVLMIVALVSEEQEAFVVEPVPRILKLAPLAEPAARATIVHLDPTARAALALVLEQRIPKPVAPVLVEQLMIVLLGPTVLVPPVLVQEPRTLKLVKLAETEGRLMLALREPTPLVPLVLEPELVIPKHVLLAVTEEPPTSVHLEDIRPVLPVLVPVHPTHKLVQIVEMVALRRTLVELVINRRELSVLVSRLRTPKPAQRVVMVVLPTTAVLAINKLVLPVLEPLPRTLKLVHLA